MPLDDKASKFAKAKKWAKWALIGATIAVTIPFAINAGTYAINEVIPHERNTAVFTTGYGGVSVQDVLESLVDVPEILKKPRLELSQNFVTRATNFFMYTPITLRQQIEGNHVDWYTNKTRQETINILKSPKYQGVVFIGHGSDDGYSTIDSYLTGEDLAKAQVPKEDLLIQHTCYFKTGNKTLREALGAEKGYDMGESITEINNYLTAVKRLFTGY